MSNKSQNRLPIFALVILGVTTLSLFGLNYLVEQISLKQPVSIARRAPPAWEKKGNLGIDDSIEAGSKPPARKGPPSMPPDMGRPPKGMPMPPGGMMMPPPDMRRLNGGKDALDMQKGKRPREADIQPPGYPPPPQLERFQEGGPPMDPSDSQRGRDDMRYPSYPPPFYPPPEGYPPPDYGPPSDYDYPDYPPDYDLDEDEYGGYEGYEGKLDLSDEKEDDIKKEEEPKIDVADLIIPHDETADLKQDFEYEPYPDEQDYAADDYYDEYLDEED